MLQTTALEEMMASKPSRRYISEAVPFSGGYYAIWAIPGLIPDYVYDLDSEGRITDQKTVFSNSEAAIEAASKIGWQALHKRAIMKLSSDSQKKFATQKMTGEQLAVALGRLELSPHDFALIKCTSAERVFSWLDNEQDIPGDVWVITGLMELYQKHGAVDDAINIISSKSTIRAQSERYIAKQKRLIDLISLVKPNLPKKADDILVRYEAVMSDESDLNLTSKIQVMEEIAADLGLKQNSTMTR